MQDGQHYFEDNFLIKVKFIGEEVLGMEDYYAAMVPQIGLPLQVIITAAKKEHLNIAINIRAVEVSFT